MSQGLNSGGNLLLALMVARVSTPEEFGAWSLAYVAYMVALHIARSVASMPMILAPAGGDTSPNDNGALSSATSVGLVAAAGLIVAGLAYPPLQPVAWSFAAFMPVLLAQDAVRYVFFRRQQPGRAALADVTWLVIQVSGFGVLVFTDAADATSVTVAWGIGASVAVLGLLTATRLRPSLKSATTFARGHRWASIRLLADSALVTSSTHALPIIVTATSGLGAAAALRGGQTLLGGMSMVILGLTPVMTVEAVRVLRGGASAPNLVGRWSGLIFVLATAYGAVLLLIPGSIGRQLLGESWALTEPVLLPLIVQAMLRGPFTGVPIILKARYRLEAALRLRLATCIPSLLCPAVGAIAGDAVGAAWGIVVGALLVDGQCLWALRRDTARTANQQAAAAR